MKIIEEINSILYSKDGNVHSDYVSAKWGVGKEEEEDGSSVLITCKPFFVCCHIGVLLLLVLYNTNVLTARSRYVTKYM